MFGSTNNSSSNRPRKDVFNQPRSILVLGPLHKHLQRRDDLEDTQASRDIANIKFVPYYLLEILLSVPSLACCRNVDVRHGLDLQSHPNRSE